jgi:hypothetical protein
MQLATLRLELCEESIPDPGPLYSYRWPVREFRSLVSQMYSQIVCPSCTTLRKTLFHEVLSKSDADLDRDFCLHAKKVYEFVYYPTLFSSQTSCKKDKEFYQAIFERFHLAYPTSVLAPLVCYSPFKLDTSDEAIRQVEEIKLQSTARVLACLYFNSVALACLQEQATDPIQQNEPELVSTIRQLSQTIALDKTKDVQRMEMVRHQCVLELVTRINVVRGNLRRGVAALAIGATASVLTGVGVLPALAITAVSALAGAKSRWVLNGILAKSMPEGLDYTALSDWVFYAFNDHSSGPSRYIGRASESYGYLLFKLDTKEKGAVAYCDFDLRNREEPITPDNLSKLSECFREYYERGDLPLERLLSFIKTLRTALLPQSTKEPAPHLINEKTAVFLTNILMGVPAHAAVVEELLKNPSRLEPSTIGHLKFMVRRLQTLQSHLPVFANVRYEALTSPYRWPVRELQVLTTHAKRTILCEACDAARGRRFEEISAKKEHDLDKEFVTLAEQVYEHIFYPNEVKSKFVACKFDKSKYQVLLNQILQNRDAALFPLLSPVSSIPWLELAMEAIEDTARRSDKEKLSSVGTVLARMYAVSTQLLFAGSSALPMVPDEGDLIGVHEPSQRIVQIAERSPEKLLGWQEVALLRHHFILKLFRRAKEQSEDTKKMTASVITSAVVTTATTMTLGPASGALIAAPAFRIANSIISILKWEFPKSPLAALEFKFLSDDVSYAYSITSSVTSQRVMATP